MHKNAARVQTEELSFGKAYVFNPDASVDHFTAALLVEINPVALVRGHGPAGEVGQLEQYVNDRPYAANSFLSVALGRIFSTAMSGRTALYGRAPEVLLNLPQKYRLPAYRRGVAPRKYSVEQRSKHSV